MIERRMILNTSKGRNQMWTDWVIWQAIVYPLCSGWHDCHIVCRVWWLLSERLPLLKFFLHIYNCHFYMFLHQRSPECLNWEFLAMLLFRFRGLSSGVWYRMCFEGKAHFMMLSIVLNGKMIDKWWIARIWKEAVMVWCEVLSQHLPGGIE
jgi:hypothetical protein